MAEHDAPIKEVRMRWGTFGQIVVLIVIFAFVTNFVKCMHDTYCTKCKKG